MLIGGKPAWRIGDQHTCSIPNAPPPACDGAPHGPGVTVPGGGGGEGVTLIGGKPGACSGRHSHRAARACAVAPAKNIVAGETTVLIGQGGGGGLPGINLNALTYPVREQKMCDVNIITGEVYHQQSDIFLPGFIPFQVFENVSKSSKILGLPGILLDVQLGSKHIFQSGKGTDATWIDSRKFHFPPIAVGAVSIRRGSNRMTGAPYPSSAELQASDGITLVFASRDDRFLLSEITDLFGNRIIIYRNVAGLITDVLDTCDRRRQFTYDVF